MWSSASRSSKIVLLNHVDKLHPRSLQQHLEKSGDMQAYSLSPALNQAMVPRLLKFRADWGRKRGHGT